MRASAGWRLADAAASSEAKQGSSHPCRNVSTKLSARNGEPDANRLAQSPGSLACRGLVADMHLCPLCAASSVCAHAAGQDKTAEARCGVRRRCDRDRSTECGLPGRWRRLRGGVRQTRGTAHCTRTRARTCAQSIDGPERIASSEAWPAVPKPASREQRVLSQIAAGPRATYQCTDRFRTGSET